MQRRSSRFVQDFKMAAAAVAEEVLRARRRQLNWAFTAIYVQQGSPEKIKIEMICVDRHTNNLASDWLFSGEMNGTV